MGCKALKRAKEATFAGIVTKKYYDSANHLTETIVIKDNLNRILMSNFFLLEESNAFNLIQVGDSVEKAKDELSIIVHNRNEKINLRYTCKN